jgi:hypothetical protein
MARERDATELIDAGSRLHYCNGQDGETSPLMRFF